MGRRRAQAAALSPCGGENRAAGLSKDGNAVLQKQ
jgi:hypothetical protein